ncbi:MAG: DEAD/DEAH box helicase family protein [Oscillospiraceae bacterium]|nr:DEAD/DEAH box helicase family protein [Oscillospiraceae bacterium]
MCGIPAHTLDQYVKRLCGEGYDVIVARMRGNDRMLSSFPAPDMAKAQRLINDFCESEFGHPADIQDLQDIGLAYSTVTDAELEIQVNANLIDFSIDRYVLDYLIERRQYGSLSELIDGELTNLDCDELVSLSTSDLEKVIERRFRVVETDGGYEVWDEATDNVYVEETGISEEFTSQWQAEDYRKKVIEAVIGKEYVPMPIPSDTSLTLPDVETPPAPPALEVEEEEPAEKETPTTLAPPKPKRERVAFSILHPEIPAEQRHNFRIQNPRLGFGTPGEKYTRNTAVIRTLKQIEYEDRLATPEEQHLLSGYVGWGGLADCFDERNSHYKELKLLLDPEEYAAARASTLTAFYTSPVIIQAIYQALSQMGFQRGNILEPACGVGNFIGMLPESMAESKVYGVELDSLSGRIAQQLYQNSSIVVDGFERVQIPDSFFDVAIGNVPFGDFKVRDKRYDKNHWLIHDYFFGKTLDKVRPGGIIAFITSKGTLDKENPAVRKYLAQRADLIGAIRLPDTAFKKNAGTDVTSDIIFLQKRDRMTDIEPDWVHLDTDENGIHMNRYFVQHPEMIMGEMVMESTQFGMDSVCKPFEDADLGQQLQEAIQNLHAEISEYQVEELDEEDNSIPADPAVRNFSYTIVDGKIYYRENSLMYPVEVSVTAENRIRGMIALRDCTRRLIEYQTEGYQDEDIAKEQVQLNSLYDSYTKKYGLLCSRGNNLAFGEDSSYFLLCSLEVLDEEGNLKRKADMFSKRTIRPHQAVTSVDTASEALAVSISEKAGVDMEYMAELSGKTQEELAEELTGVIFRDVACAEKAEDIPADFVDVAAFPFVSADEYLSGNVRRKLRMAKALYVVLPAEKKGLIAKNVEALEAVQPVDLTAAEIGVRIGANWVPIEIYQQFMEELFGTSAYARNRIKILRSQASGQWSITEKNADRGNIKAIATYGSQRMTAYHILEQTLNQKDVRVFDYVEDEHGNKRPVLNKKETAIAQDRQELIKSKFAEWIWKDIDRRERLCAIYNETFNSIRPREYDGQHITFYGMNPEITLRKHQIDAIAHIMYGGNTLLAHEVGAGKTFEMVAAAMEMKRLGLCTKSLVVVPNHITEQWAAEWLQLYPSANILVATKKDFETKNRKKFCARIATGDYDAIIIGHSQFEKIPISAERQRAILEEQVDQIILSIEEAKAAKAERYTVKQLEKMRATLEGRLDRLNDQSRKDSLVTFEELGVDRIFIDESHYFKNLFLATKMRNVGGIAQTEAQKSSDLFTKCRYLDEITGGKGVIFATGTPISNSMVELYTIQRYLQYSTLEEMGLTFFDDWASDFGETITAIELSPEGTGYRAKTRFAKFFNLPELMATFKQVADIQTADMLKLPVPKANFHTEVISPSELQQKMIKGLAERAEKIRNSNVDPSVDNMLKITNDGRKLALDMRLINPLAADDPNGKVAVCAHNVYQIWERTKEQRSAQLVFCDLSTPKGDGSFNVYDDLKKKLMEAGIPEEEIAFIHEANTEVRKKELFARVRSGQVRILMGSTQKMGAGTNVQDRLVALHDLDCPWRPSDLAQRLGRIVRQGNENPEVDIYRYVTEGTFDAYLYQLVENKQKFIAQIMTSKAPVRITDDVDETALSYSEIKALATGNPLIIEKCNLDMEVGKLHMLKANYLSQKYGLEEMVLRKYPAEIQRLAEQIAGYEQDVALVAAHPKPQEGFVGIEINGTAYTDKEAAGKAILDVCTKMTGSDAVPLGQYRGFSLVLAYDGVQNEYRVTLKGTLSHSVVLGADVLGNLTRMDNSLGNLENWLSHTQLELAENKKQLENAKQELAAPFAKESELAEKEARLKELNILLNMDQKDNTLLDSPDDEEIAPERAGADRER